MIDPSTHAENFSLKPPHTQPAAPYPGQQEQRTLLAALRARTLVPVLLNWLSKGQSQAREDDPRILRDWIASMGEDPGWTILGPRVEAWRAQPALQSTSASQDVWQQACAAGWSARTDHHHALLFARFCDDALAAGEFDAAQAHWTQCVDAWLRVLDSDYLDAWLRKMNATDATLRRHLLEPLIEPRIVELRAAVGVDRPAAASTLDLPRLRFAREALAYLSSRVESSDSREPALLGLDEAVTRAQADL